MKPTKHYQHYILPKEQDSGSAFTDGYEMLLEEQDGKRWWLNAPTLEIGLAINTPEGFVIGTFPPTDTAALAAEKLKNIKPTKEM